MPDILNSYLRYARGESRRPSPWSLLNVTGAILAPFVRMRNALYDRGIFCRIDPPVPVISVGNLCHGGTNKTPMVEMIARRLMTYGLSVGIVSRGYGGETKEPLWIGQDSWSSDRSITGDEPLMLARRLPEARIVVSRDRYEGVRLLARLGSDVVVADDAFQHRRMGRDLDIVLIDATCPFGNGRLFPAGILREQQDALLRADIVILTKAEQAGPEEVARIREMLGHWISLDCIFTACVEQESWMEMTNGTLGEFEPEWGQTHPEGRFLSFSAIGNPDSFRRSLVAMGLDIVRNCAYRDHHRFTWKDLDDLERQASELGATGFICTEKDLQNMPEGFTLLLPLYVPRIAVRVEEDDRLWRLITEKLKPEFVVASNGYGEDAIGALLASRLRDRFPGAEISAFSLVGGGKEYWERGIRVLSPRSDMPSGGVVKYSLKALLGDFRHGLRRDIKRQISAWREQQGRFRTPICVGDVYLLAHTLWGQGLSPALVATAKSVRLSGHWMAERKLMRSRARKVWTRDEETALELQRARVDADFRGNPIMDLALDGDPCASPWEAGASSGDARVMLLPGSRPRAYDDIALLLDAVCLLAESVSCRFVMVLAPTIEQERLLPAASYPCDDRGRILVGRAAVTLYTGPIASAAYGADLLIGLGGTANQVSAGLGVPVLSIVERGKLVQKKLLGDSELLVPATAAALAEAAKSLLADPVRRNRMSEAGIRMLGGPGTIDAVAEYAAGELGWEARCKLYAALRRAWATDDAAATPAARHADMGEEEKRWNIPETLRNKLRRAVRIVKEGRRPWGSEETGLS